MLSSTTRGETHEEMVEKSDKRFSELVKDKRYAMKWMEISALALAIATIYSLITVLSEKFPITPEVPAIIFLGFYIWRSILNHKIKKEVLYQNELKRMVS